MFDKVSQSLYIMWQIDNITQLHTEVYTMQHKTINTHHKQSIFI